MKKIFNSRIISIIVLVLVFCALLSSCTSSTTQTTELKVEGFDGSKNLLSNEQLNSIATTIYNDQTAREAFLAAYRGYDVIDGNDTDYSVDKGPNYAFLEKVIEKYTNENVPLEDETPAETPSEEPAEENPSEEGTPVEETPTESTPVVTGPTKEEKLEKFKVDVDLILKSMQTNIELNPERDILGYIRYGIGYFLGLITNTVGFGHYLIGICIFAIIIEILMLPFAIKQQKNSIKQAKLRPKEMAIRNRYKGRNDQATQQKVTQEIQELYQRENFNPMSGCLPMLVQLPIIMLLYNNVVDPITNVLGGSADLANALKVFATTSKAAGGLGMSLGTSSGTIEILSHLKAADFSTLENFHLFSNSGAVADYMTSIQGNIPSFSILGINFGLNPSLKENFWLLIVPVLTFVVYFGSMKISKKFTYQPTQNENAPGAGCSSKMMEWYMPIMSTVFCFMVPGAVGVYWVFRSILSTVKQFIMSKLMPLPKCTDEDIREAERELNAKKPQRKKKNTEDLDPNRERPRSLHHIDDDDEDYPTFVE